MTQAPAPPLSFPEFLETTPDLQQRASSPQVSEQAAKAGDKNKLSPRF